MSGLATSKPRDGSVAVALLIQLSRIRDSKPVREPSIRWEMPKAAAASRIAASPRMIPVRRRNHFQATRQASARLEPLQQPFDVIVLELRPRALARAAPEFVEDFARFLNVGLAGVGDVAIVVGAVAGALAAELIAIGGAARQLSPLIAAFRDARDLSRL